MNTERANAQSIYGLKESRTASYAVLASRPVSFRALEGYAIMAWCPCFFSQYEEMRPFILYGEKIQFMTTNDVV